MTRKGDMYRELVYQFLKTYIEREGYPPSVREIGDGVGLSSTSSVQYHLDTLEKTGRIQRLGRKGYKRWIKLTG